MNSVVHVANELPALLTFAQQAIVEQRYLHAAEACEAALRLDANSADAHHYLSHAYKGLGRPDWAHSMMMRALMLAPTNAQLNYNAAVDAYEAGDQHRAMIHYQRALRHAPDMPDALWNYGECLRMDEHFDQALACFERLVTLGQTHYQGLWHRMAVCYAALEWHDEAQKSWRRAISGEHDILSDWEYSFYLLSLEDYANGTRYYNDRFLCDGRNSVYQHEFPYPLWDGVFKAGMTVLVHGEQGLGDEIMFASMFNELLDAAEHAHAQVIIGCKPPLVRLFAESFPRAIVRAHKVGAAPIDTHDLSIDAQMAMGHLMSLYRRTEADFAAHRHAYLRPNAARTAYYAQQIRHLGRESQDGKRRFRVGLMWGSNPALISNRFSRWAGQKSIDLSMFTDFADLTDEVEFISLQNAERGAEAALLPTLQLIDFSLDQADFYDTAALIANLDLVISVDTSVCHLSGGMTCETWVPLISRPDWRHGRTRNESLWYAGTQYFRQNQKNDWSEVIERIHKALLSRVNQWSSAHESQ